MSLLNTLLADLLATIDCYYVGPCDRTRFAFKPFARWTKYDFPMPWLYRACDENDYRRGIEAARRERVPLLAPTTTMSSSVVDAGMRKREVLHRPTRRATSGLSGSAVSAPPAVNDRTVPEAASNTVRASSALQAIGCHDAARRAVQQAAPGIPAIAANQDPQTVAEALGTLEDDYHRMLAAAARGDRDARDQAALVGRHAAKPSQQHPIQDQRLATGPSSRSRSPGHRPQARHVSPPSPRQPFRRPVLRGSRPPAPLADASGARPIGPRARFVPEPPDVPIPRRSSALIPTR